MGAWPLVEDGIAPTVFFDDVGYAEVRDGVLRVVLCQRRFNSVTQRRERLVTGTLIRPTSVTLAVNRAIARALAEGEATIGPLLN